MSAAREQLAADLATVLVDPNGPADPININGIDMQAIRQPVDWLPNRDLEGTQVEREILFLLQADLGFIPVPWQELLIDNRGWFVEAVPEKGQVLELAMVRYLS